jgi:hypothetical protein
MVYTKDDFNARVGAVDKKLSRRGRHAVVAHVTKNGVIYRKAKRGRTGLPLRGVIVMGVSFFCFKALLLSANGPAAYEERLALLQEGTVIEAMGAWVLGIDPLTQFIADQAGPLFR